MIKAHSQASLLCKDGLVAGTKPLRGHRYAEDRPLIRSGLLSQNKSLYAGISTLTDLKTGHLQN